MKMYFLLKAIERILPSLKKKQSKGKVFKIIEIEFA